MSPVTKLAVFALGLVLVFLAALGAGAAVRDGEELPRSDHGRHPEASP